MVPTQITDDGPSIKIIIGTKTRNVIKSTIEDITSVDGTILKIDIGRGPLGNIFIPYTDVSVPVTAGLPALVAAVNAMLAPLDTSTATEARQIEQITLLNTLTLSLASIQSIVNALDKKIFTEPLRIDDSGVKVVYKGYAIEGTNEADPTWAIERIENVDEVELHSWADGNKNFDNIWTNRESLVYS